MASVLGSHLDIPGAGEFRVVAQERAFTLQGEVPVDGTPVELVGVPVLLVTLEMVSPVERARRN